MHTTTAKTPEMANRDRRTWLAGAIAQEMMTYSRHQTLKRLQSELRHLEREAVCAGWIAPCETRALRRDARDLAWVS